MTAEELNQIIANPLSTADQKRHAKAALRELESAASVPRIDVLLEPLFLQRPEDISEQWTLDATAWQLFLDLASTALGIAATSSGEYSSILQRLEALCQATNSRVIRDHTSDAIANLARHCPVPEIRDEAQQFVNSWETQHASTKRS